MIEQKDLEKMLQEVLEKAAKEFIPFGQCGIIYNDCGTIECVPMEYIDMQAEDNK